MFFTADRARVGAAEIPAWKKLIKLEKIN
jgi:hypothetical protein